MLEHMIAECINQTFEDQVMPKSIVGPPDDGKVMYISVRVGKDSETEQLAIYAWKGRYVTVLRRRTPRHITQYVYEGGGWECICHHDSCWRNEVQSWVFNNSKDFNGFDSTPKGFLKWFSVETLSSERMNELEQVRKDSEKEFSKYFDKSIR